MIKKKREKMKKTKQRDTISLSNKTSAFNHQTEIQYDTLYTSLYIHLLKS